MKGLESMDRNDEPEADVDNEGAGAAAAAETKETDPSLIVETEMAKVDRLGHRVSEHYGSETGDLFRKEVRTIADAREFFMEQFGEIKAEFAEFFDGEETDDLDEMETDQRMAA